MKTQNTVIFATLAAVCLAAFSRAEVLDIAGFTRSIDLSVSGYTGSSTLSGFPVLVRLGPSLGGFRYSDFASPDGGDLAFTDAEGNALPYEIDTWNTNGESLVWVRLPSMAKGTAFRAYYGKADAPANNPASVWSDYVSVHHFGEDSGTAFDATGHGYDGIPSGDRASGMVAYENGAVGRARVNQTGFDGKAYLSLANSESLALGTQFHVSGWFLANGVTNYPRLIARKAHYADKNGWEYLLPQSPATITVHGASSTYINATVPDLTEDWRHITLVYNGTTAIVYTNGVKGSSGSITAATDNGCPISFGCNSNGSETSLNGQYDEIRIAKTIPSVDWALAEYRSMAVADFVKAQPVANLAEARTFHVDATNGDDTADGLSWETSLASIQRALDLACSGDEILVADGTYAPIDSRNLGVTIRSVNGAETTIIDGGGTNRCATLGTATNDVVKTMLVGFTLQNGNADVGGGTKGGIIEECIVQDNVSTLEKGNICGGGAAHAELRRCIVQNNACTDDGGGVSGCILYDCLVAGNHADNAGLVGTGGGVDNSTAIRCTIVGNTAVKDPSDKGPGGAGTCQSVLVGCIVYGNKYTDGTDGDDFSSTATYSCFGSAVDGTGNIVADPLFVDSANDDYRLQAGSPCIDAGSNSGVTWKSVDLDGMHRRIGSTTDMGCYEFTTHREPTTMYVDAAIGDDTNDGLAGSSAKATIQAALNWSIDRDIILVNDGIYTSASGGFVVNNEFANRCVTIRSVNGPEKTIIDGGGTGRCAKLSASSDGRYTEHVATLVGFTLTNGANVTCGGVSHGIVDNCIIVGCTTTESSKTLENIGAVMACRLSDSLIVSNTAVQAEYTGVLTAGAALSILCNCTIYGNSVANGSSAGGLYDCTAYNCIVQGNTVGGIAADVADCALTNCCLTSLQRGAGNIVAFAEFADEANGDFRLRLDSPCIDAGNDAYATAGATDLWGNPRIQGARVDMGAYEVGSGSWLHVEDSDVVYNGASNALVVAADFPGATATVLYALSADGPFTAEAPAFRDVGSHIVWVAASAPGYPSVTNSATITVRKKAIDPSMMCVVPDQVWDGTPKRPEVHIRDGWPDILSASDYTVEYIDNTDVGTAGVRVTGQGNYEGSFVYPFSIDPVDETRFLVIDLSGGTAAESFPVSYLSDIPAGGWTDEYKTTKLVLRKVPEGSFWMGSPEDELGRGDNEPLHHVTLSRPFYAAVFETTQKQWELVMGTNPSSVVGDSHPVETVSYDDIRGTNAGTNFPASTAVDAASFLGILRVKTGLDGFDLPTEAQWEYACRAGTVSALNSGKDLETTDGYSANLAEVGRYTLNRGETTHTIVGLFFPNRWGLYDMHGNVWEWCRDWMGELSKSKIVNPLGGVSGSGRVCRGGSWAWSPLKERSSYRYADSILGPNGDFTTGGFRLVCAEPEPVDTVWYVDAENGSDDNTGRSWDEALRTIQNATDRSVSGNEVVVTNGVYEPFTAINLDIVIRSVEGAENTIIDGDRTNRCATLGSSTNDVVKTTLVGFTLRNGGHTLTDNAFSGGNAFGGELHDCILIGGQARNGGGAYKSVLRRCVLSRNTAGDDGGGARESILYDCLVWNNRSENIGGSWSGGGLRGCAAYRCSIVGNQSVYGSSSKPGSAGVDTCTVGSCIVYGNTYTTGASSDAYECTATYSCFGSAVTGTSNIVANPLFVDAANGDYRLQAGSPCIDAGNGQGALIGTTDLDGHTRWQGVSADMGCYEFGTHYTATTLHVDATAGDDANTGFSWETAKATIQNALDWAVEGDTILVKPSVYKEDKHVIGGIYNAKGINATISSTDGPTVTFIDGDNSRRAVKGTASETQADWTNHVLTINGFTIQNGRHNGPAAAVWCNLLNCIVRENTSINDNTVNYARLKNCLVVGNVASNANLSAEAHLMGEVKLVNCTVYGNHIANVSEGAAINGGSVVNSIVCGNTGNGSLFAPGVAVSHTCADTATTGTGNIVADETEVFIDAADGDFRLRSDSPCIDAGDTAFVAETTDLAGTARVAHGTVDMGCHEYDRPAAPTIDPGDGTQFTKTTQTVLITHPDPSVTVYCTTDGSDPTASSSTRLKFSIRDTTTVKAVGIGADGSMGEVAVATIIRVVVAQAPDGLAAEQEGAGIALEWEGVATADGYRIYRGTSPDIAAATLLGSTDGTAWTDTTFEVGRTYYYFVLTENLAGVSEAGTPALGSTLGLATAVNMPQLVFTTGAGCPWTAEMTGQAADQVHRAVSGTPANNGESWLETTVQGPGQIDFAWAVSCELDDSGERDWDHLEFLVDGVELARIDGETGWEKGTFAVAGAGTHTLRWVYVKDSSMADGEDRGFLDCVAWRSDAALGDWEAWVDFHGLASPSGYEALKPKPSGKGGTLYDEFVAGLNPLDPLSRFLADIRMEGDTPLISWDPDLNENGTKQVRVYTVEGKNVLTDSWGPTNTTSHFFHVKVGMPE